MAVLVLFGSADRLPFGSCSGPAAAPTRRHPSSPIATLLLEPPAMTRMIRDARQDLMSYAFFGILISATFLI
jgi:hypothetical protein